MLVERLGSSTVQRTMTAASDLIYPASARELRCRHSVLAISKGGCVCVIMKYGDLEI